MRIRLYSVILAALVAITLMFAGIAIAGEGADESFRSMDVNGDQMLDPNEFAQGYEGTSDAQAEFDAADEDMSGTMDATEWAKYQKAHGMEGQGGSGMKSE
ncbi:hypothetical protein [Oceanidesulfovibrio marinus]|uniref:EF-hand domain-containing protein n=1 Tax=Oceanidesulfovibrio marinus TaxID=370038 RepID=A0ABX6NGS1_9BACT|nr:hypothetical protein [Oceanidesulfovibrio marinus]QJT09248.1 hypothetical protein E8L03_09990 [Oceanidesulfovibrio marinus]